MHQKKLMLIAGEPSGDMHAAAVVTALRRHTPQVDVFGIGGAALRQAGMRTIYDTRDMAVLGLTEVLRRYFFFRRVLREMTALARAQRPDVVLLVDYPGFNLRFAAAAKRMGLKVIYYVCPQVWAWNRGRIPMMARRIDRLLAIFPFETDLFAGTGLKVDFVGHPLASLAAAARGAPADNLPWQSGNPRVAMLAGSRRHEIRRLFPVMWRAAVILERQFPGAAFIAAAPDDLAGAWINAEIAKLGPGPKRFALVTGRTRQALRQADAAMVASGTATLETTLMQCPMVIIYKVSPATYLAGRVLIRVPYLGMVNIIWSNLRRQSGGPPLCPELIQHAATPERLARAITPLLQPTPQRQAMLAGMEEVNRVLGNTDAAEHAAGIVLEELAPGQAPAAS